jgi:Flp pilus assembly protein TadD
MGRRTWCAWLALVVGACAQTIPEHVRDLSADGIHLFERGSYPQARDTFQAALRLQPGDPHLQYNLARCYHALGQREQAETSYRACLQVDTNHVDCHHALVMLLLETGRREAADTLVEEWLKTQPGRSGPYVEHAFLLVRDEKFLDARGRLQQALALDPRNARALGDLGQLYERMGYPDRAVLLYERSLEIQSGQPDLVQKIAVLRARGTNHPRPDS